MGGGFVHAAAEAALRSFYPALARDLRDLRVSQWRSPDEIEALSWRRTQEVLRYAYEHTDFYRKKFDEAGLRPLDIQHPDDLARVPSTTKQEFREALRSHWPLSSEKLPRQARLSTTGSSGQPLAFPIDRRGQDRRLAIILRDIEWYGHRLGDRNARLWGRAEEPGESHLHWWSPGRFQPIFEKFKKEVAGRRLEIITHDRSRPDESFIDEQRLAQWLQKIERYRPRVIDGYVSILVHLAQYILQTGARPPGCVAVVTGGEHLSESDRLVLEKAFRCPVLNRYGGTEAGFVAHECGHHPQHKLHLNAEALWVEFVRKGQPVSAGESGEILITDFTNHAAPLIRYRVGDIGRPAARGELCPCGRGLPLMDSVDGRVDDLFHLPDGRVLVSHVWHELFADQDFIRSFRLTQLQRDLVRVEVALDATDPRYSPFKQRIESFLQGCTVNWVEVDHVESGPGGKQRFAISRIPVSDKLA